MFQIFEIDSLLWMDLLVELNPTRDQQDHQEPAGASLTQHGQAGQGHGGQHVGQVDIWRK